MQNVIQKSHGSVQLTNANTTKHVTVQQTKLQTFNLHLFIQGFPNSGFNDLHAR